MDVLGRDFYDRDTKAVARELIGKWLVHKEDGWGFCGRIVETEAYLGQEDLASHLANGFTKRTAGIWGHPGRAYVFLCYGLHACLNAITLSEPPYGCVLIRAVEPFDRPSLPGFDTVTARTDGPGRLTKAFGIDIRHNGKDLTRDCIQIWAPVKEYGDHKPEIRSSRRIGISKAKEKQLRFYDAQSPWVSRR